jgi:hypothetical protein
VNQEKKYKKPLEHKDKRISRKKRESKNLTIMRTFESGDE